MICSPVAGRQLLDRVALSVAERARVDSTMRLITALDFEVELFAKLAAGRCALTPAMSRSR